MDPSEKIKVSPEEMGNLISLAFQKFRRDGVQVLNYQCNL
jgi:hypothetical protein